MAFLSCPFSFLVLISAFPGICREDTPVGCLRVCFGHESVFLTQRGHCIAFDCRVMAVEHDHGDAKCSTCVDVCCRNDCLQVGYSQNPKRFAELHGFSVPWGLNGCYPVHMAVQVGSIDQLKNIPRTNKKGLSPLIIESQNSQGSTGWG